MKKLSIIAVILIVVFLASQAFASSSWFYPISDGTYTEWTPMSRAPHYTFVDDSPCNGDVDYVSTFSPGAKDSYYVDLSQIPDGAYISDISIVACTGKASVVTSENWLGAFYVFNGFEDYIIEQPLPYTTTTMGFAHTAPYTWSNLMHEKWGATPLEIGMIYTGGESGVRVSNFKVKIDYFFQNRE